MCRLFISLMLGLALASAQAPPPSILEIVVENRAFYINDVTDYSRLAVSATAVPTPQVTARTFAMVTAVGDIVSIGGSPARGTWVARYQILNLNPIPAAGQALADVQRLSLEEAAWEIQQADGASVGTLFTRGLALGPIAPGAPPGAITSNFAITGGTGVYAGMRGQAAQIRQTFGRATSTTEDPSNRRLHGGGAATFVFDLMPREAPGIAAVLHSDFNPVSAQSPARPGETLILAATGLGPTRPELPPGESFTDGSPRAVVAPIRVMAGGRSVAAVNQLGWPETADRFRVDFTLPADITGPTVPVSLNLAGIGGPAVVIPVSR